MSEVTGTMHNIVGKYMFFSVLTNSVLSLLKILFGFLGHSNALFVDGFHSLSDLISDFIAIFGGKLSAAKEDDKHPKGHGKIEYLTSIVIAIIITAMGFTLLRNSFLGAKKVIPDNYVIIVALITIISKYVLSRLLISKGKKHSSNILITSGRESFTDVYTTSLVLISVIASQFSKQFSLLSYADFVSSIIISVVIIVIGVKLLVENLSLTIGEREMDLTKLVAVEEYLTKLHPDVTLGGLELIKLGQYYDAELTILLPKKTSLVHSHAISHEMEENLINSDFNISHVNIHIEPKEGEVNAGTTRSRNSKGTTKKSSPKQKNK